MSVIPETPAERRKHMLDERQQASTLHQHGVTAADDEAGGRFAKQEGAQPQVIGTDPIPKYPQLPSGPWSGDDPVGIEPLLGYRIDAMPELGQNPTGTSQPVAPGGAEAPSTHPRGLSVEHAAPPSSSDDGGNDADTR
jgi:hypothetical protein